MMKKEKKLLCVAIVLTILALAYTAAVRLIDVRPIGPEATEVGFSAVNGAVASAIGSDENGFTYSEKLYDLTEKIGLASFLWVAAFGLMGLIQWIKRKNLFKVDAEILSIGMLYVATGIVYVLFTKIAVNYRPVMMPGETAPEASFPSSHTVQALVIWLSAAAVIGRYVKNKGLVAVLQVLLPVAGCASVVLRALSGVHWASDIVGGIGYAAMLLGWFAFFLFVFRRKRAAAAKKRHIAKPAV